jgi:hypothetical protein
MVLTRRAAKLRLSCGRAFTELCTWATTIPLAAVPPEVRKRACLVLADDMAAIVAAATEPEVAVNGSAGASAFARGQQLAHVETSTCRWADDIKAMVAQSVA